VILAGASLSNPVGSLLILIVVAGGAVLVNRSRKRNDLRTAAVRAAALDRARDLLASEGRPPSVTVACATPVSCINSNGTPYWVKEPRIVALTRDDLVTFDQHGDRRETVHLSEVVSTVITRSAFDVTLTSGTKHSYRPYDADGHALLVHLAYGVRSAAASSTAPARRSAS
jgi:hypothetical protein